MLFQNYIENLHISDLGLKNTTLDLFLESDPIYFYFPKNTENFTYQETISNVTSEIQDSFNVVKTLTANWFKVTINEAEDKIKCIVKNVELETFLFDIRYELLCFFTDIESLDSKANKDDCKWNEVLIFNI